MRFLCLVALATRLAAQAPAAPPDSTVSLVDRAARVYRVAKTVRASFEQTLTSPATGGAHTSRGEYFQSGGSKFALRFTDPVGDAIVNDGTSLWFYLPSTARGQAIKMPSEAGKGFDVLAELLSAPKANYLSVRLRDESVDGHATSVYSLSPRRPDLPFTRATLWIGKSDALIWQLETVEQSGLVRRVHFTSVRTDVDLPDDALIFTVPAGVKVLDQSALFGKKPL